MLVEFYHCFRVCHQSVPNTESQECEYGVLFNFQVSEAVNQQMPAQVQFFYSEVEPSHQFDH